MEWVKYAAQSLPLVVVLVVWAVRLEIRIARMQTDLCWIKKKIPLCQPTLEKTTP